MPLIDELVQRRFPFEYTNMSATTTNSVLYLRPRPRALRYVRVMPAITASLSAGLAFLLGYYGTLALLPAASRTGAWAPLEAWGSRCDLSHFIGSLMLPSLSTAATWFLGLCMVMLLLVLMGVGYAVLLSAVEQSSTVQRGITYGVLLFVNLGILAWIANGFHPAIMGRTLPDPGFFFLGWSPWASLHLAVLHLVYGAVLGALYRRRVY